MMTHSKLWLPLTDASNYHKGRETSSVHFNAMANLQYSCSCALFCYLQKKSAWTHPGYGYVH